MKSDSEATYIDSSALVKLILDEPEAPALRRTLGSTPMATSILGIVETRRAIGRTRPGAGVAERMEEILSRTAVVALDPTIAARAARLAPPILRTLDAIHLASALQLAPALSSFVTYDARLAAAAADAGLNVIAPA